MIAVHVRYYTDPFCPWSWGVEPHLRRLRSEFGAGVEFSYVIVGLARQMGDEQAAKIGLSTLDAAAKSGMPADARVFLRDHPKTTYPAGLAVQAIEEQDRGALLHRYVRALREAVFLERRPLDHGDALLDVAREIGGVDLDRLRIDFGSNHIVEQFGVDLERARAVAQEHHEPGSGRVKVPSIEATGADGATHGAYGYVGYEDWRAAVMAAGARPARTEPPGVVEALGGSAGRISVAELAAVCGLPGERVQAQLWRLAEDWRARPETIPGAGVLWRAAA